jgi:hypothetical protein
MSFHRVPDNRCKFVIAVLLSCMRVPIPRRLRLLFARRSQKLAMLPRLNLNSLFASCRQLGYVLSFFDNPDCFVRRNQTRYRHCPWHFISVQPGISQMIDLMVQMKHVANPKRQYCANVCLKINAKLGGANVYLPPRHMPFVSERPTVSLP